MYPIDRLHIYRVGMPLIYPWTTAYGSDDVIQSVLVRMISGGRHGWGESTPLRFPAYSPESAAGVFMTVRDFLGPLLLGHTIGSGAELQQRLAGCKGNYFAKGALDNAWWDMYARDRNEPLWKVVGGTDPVVQVGEDFGVMDSVDDLLAAIERAVERGFKRIKLKFSRAWGMEMLTAVRRRFPGIAMHIDCNSAFSLDDLEMFRQIDRCALAMIEQPLAHDDLVDHAELQSKIATPICLDESITSAHRARKAIRIGACRWINIKPGRVGGLTNALEIHRVCHEADVPCWIGGMLESSLGTGLLSALATLPNIRYPSDVFPTSRFYRQDLCTPALAYSGPSQITAPGGPGAGAEPDPERLERMTLESATLGG